jgi:tellurite resistance protein TehA-like permease
MPEVSAAIIVLAGAVLVVGGIIPSSLTDASRQRIVGIGYLLVGLGVVAWLIAFGIVLFRIAKAV